MSGSHLDRAADRSEWGLAGPGDRTDEKAGGAFPRPPRHPTPQPRFPAQEGSKLQTGCNDLGPFCS